MSRESAVDRVKARIQWETLCSALQQNGCQLETIDAVQARGEYGLGMKAFMP
ncbi:MAG TPA: hypothetical protein VKF84_09530 [Candidatus Sulfotelmatobacter sp.]|nr:hypothetical protein [Candidatus Sulfotelmatobacter sp.]